MYFGFLTKWKFNTRECEVTKVVIERKRVLGLNTVAMELRKHYLSSDFLH